MHKNSFALNHAIISFKKHQYAHERYQNLTKEEKAKARIWPKRYKNLSEDEKQKLVEYRKKVLRNSEK